MGTLPNLIVEPFGQVQTYDSCVLTRAFIVEPDSPMVTKQKVVLKVSLSDWVACSCRIGALKVLQTRVEMDTDSFLLDTTQVGSGVAYFKRASRNWRPFVQ